VTPDSSWPEETLTFTVNVAPSTPKPGRFALAAYTPTNADSQPFTPSFRYLIVSVP
jgi:hypothetical protein